MATTIRQMCERTFFEAFGATSEPQAGVYFFQIEAMMPEAADRLASMYVDAPRPLRSFITKAFTIANSGGQFPLAPYPELRIDSLPLSVVEHASSTYPLEYLADPSELAYPQPAGVALWTLDNDVIRTVTREGIVGGMIGDLTIRNAVYVPVVAASAGSTTLHPRLEDEFVSILVGMVRDKIAAGSAGGQVPA